MAAKKTAKNARKVAVKVAPVPVVPALTLSFNRQPLTFDASVIASKVAAMRAVKPPVPASGKHKAHIPGVEYPVSLGWAVEALTGVKAQGISAAGNIKGAYHPQQAMDMLSKLAPYGVKVETTSDNPRYHKHGTAAAEAFERLKAALTPVQTPAMPIAPVEEVKVKSAKKSAKKVAAKTTRK